MLVGGGGKGWGGEHLKQMTGLTLHSFPGKWSNGDRTLGGPETRSRYECEDGAVDLMGEGRTGDRKKEREGEVTRESGRSGRCSAMGVWSGQVRSGQDRSGRVRTGVADERRDEREEERDGPGEFMSTDPAVQTCEVQCSKIERTSPSKRCQDWRTVDSQGNRGL